MTISAKVLADSIAANGQRVTTFHLVFPRFELPSVNTHRMFSRNTSSSRAIPVKRLISAVRENPAAPIHWGKNQPGMKADHELPDLQKGLVKGIWHAAMWFATGAAQLCDMLGGSKETVNRLIEPFAHSSTVITSTQWSNFYALRRHRDAQTEIKALADAMYDAQQASEPVVLADGEWHLPYVTDEDRQAAKLYVANRPDFELPTRFIDPLPVTIDKETQFLLAVSVARCARTSYRLHDGNPTTFEDDVKLYARLLAAQPLHASPAEHQATSIPSGIGGEFSGNLSGVIQFRKLLVGETT